MPNSLVQLTLFRVGAILRSYVYTYKYHFLYFSNSITISLVDSSSKQNLIAQGMKLVLDAGHVRLPRSNESGVQCQSYNSNM